IETPVWGLPAFLIATLLILSIAVQLRASAAPRLKHLARGALLGLALVVGGLLAEWQWGIALAVVKGEVLLPALWRLGLHVGAVLLAWAAIRFLTSRHETVGRVGFGHGLVTAVSAFAIVAVLLAWRVLGAFPPWLYW